MARRVFFSFHYEADIWRVGQVRNSWVTRDREAAGFWDAADWESVKRGGDAAIRRWINDQLLGTSVTAVLIGQSTAEREYVLYEIEQSYKKGNGLLGIYIHQCADRQGNTCWRGQNPLEKVFADQSIFARSLASIYPTYDWKSDSGYHNLPLWIEDAARRAGR